MQPPAPPLPSVCRPPRVPPRFTEPLQGPELPIWIESEFVDSAAMLEAFEHYKTLCAGGALAQVKHLHVIEHIGIDTVVLQGVPIEVQKVRGQQPHTECRREGCPRCAANICGYVFRWYSWRWGQR